MRVAVRQKLLKKTHNIQKMRASKMAKIGHDAWAIAFTNWSV